MKVLHVRVDIETNQVDHMEYIKVKNGFDVDNKGLKMI